MAPNFYHWLLFNIILITCIQVSHFWLHLNNYNYKSASRRDFKHWCPNVRIPHIFDLQALMGYWYVIQYYASTEEVPVYACMRSQFTFSHNDQHITMNFTYVFTEDPLRERLYGNITWSIPEFNSPAHWIHTEDIYEGVYNTYVLDANYNSWSLIMHCAEKAKHPRYLSALLLSRKPQLSINVVNYLREKLPGYDIDLSYMFTINQTLCDN